MASGTSHRTASLLTPSPWNGRVDWRYNGAVMLETIEENANSVEMADALEQGRIVHFRQAPFPLPSEADLTFLRTELPRRLKLKNVSYHPEVDRVVGLGGDRELEERTCSILTEHAQRVQAFLNDHIPTLARNWTVGTTSFRPLQERGRGLKPHASNELIHVDAGAYGATNGDRILRFFVNVSPSEDRVWASKGAFPELLARFGRRAGIAPSKRSSGYLRKGVSDHVRSGLLRGIARVGLPLARVLDSSPYDRAMRRFHNYMKDTAEFRDSREGYQEYRFAPGSAWSVLTDMVSHACLSGQHALVSTFLLRLEDCRYPDLAPINILRRYARGALT